MPRPTDATLKKQAAGLQDLQGQPNPFGGNVLYVVLIDPAVADTEYQFFEMLVEDDDAEEQRDPATREMWKRYAGAFAAG